MTTSTDIVNQAIQLIGDNQPPVTGAAPTFDTSPAGQAAAALYVPVVNTVVRQAAWDCTRRLTTLVESGNTAPRPWDKEYLYPTDAVQIWQVLPQLADDNDPRPTTWDVGVATVSGTPTKVLWTNTVAANAVYSVVPQEGLWDSLFRETVVRLLASELAVAVQGRPDTARDSLEQSIQFSAAGQRRDS